MSTSLKNIQRGDYMDPNLATMIKDKKITEIYKQIETAAYKWFDGDITADRLAEIVFGLINEEVM